jgi:hypothetical protein
MYNLFTLARQISVPAIVINIQSLVSRLISCVEMSAWFERRIFVHHTYVRTVCIGIARRTFPHQFQNVTVRSGKIIHASVIHAKKKKGIPKHQTFTEEEYDRIRTRVEYPSQKIPQRVTGFQKHQHELWRTF